MSTAAIILADHPDAEGAIPALYPFDHQRTLIEWQIEQVLAAGVRNIEVVLGAEADRVIPLIAADAIEPIINPAWQQPESAMRVGTSAVPRGTDAALILWMEEPRASSICTTVLDTLRDSTDDVVRAASEGVPGSPIAVTAAVLDALRNVRPYHGIERTLGRFAMQLVECPSDAVTLRIERAGELAAAIDRGLI